MNTEAEELLLQTLAETEGTSSPIALVVNEKNRLIEYNGEILLGVVADDNAEQIVFIMPKLVGNNDLIDASASDVEIFIIYKNANNEIYKQQCTDITVDGDNIYFSWLLTRYVTAAKGNVSFMVCVQKLGTNAEGIPVILNEWHTTPAKGTVLVGIDTDHTTPEVLPANSIASTAQLRAEVDALSQKIDDHIIGYSRDEIDAMFEETEKLVINLENKLKDTDNPLVVNSALNATKAEQASNALKIRIIESTGSASDIGLLIRLGSVNGYSALGYIDKITVNPETGELKALKIYEDGQPLSNKYVRKNMQYTIALRTPIQGSCTEYVINNTTVDPDVDANEYTSTLEYIKYPFDYSDDILNVIRKAKYIEFLHGRSLYRFPVTSIRYLQDITSTPSKTRLQVNAIYTDNVPGGVCLNRTYYLVINMQYTTGSTANFTIYREPNSEMTWEGISHISIVYEE